MTTTDGQCSRCGRPAAPNCCLEPPSEVTADTVTDDEIRALQAGSDFSWLQVTRDAMQYHETMEPYASIRRGARARCAAAINARKAVR